MGEFTTALTNFQRLQRQAAEKEKDFVARVRASSRVSVSIRKCATVFFALVLVVFCVRFASKVLFSL